MSRVAKGICCVEAELKELKSWAGSHTVEKRLHQRAEIILRLHAGGQIKDIARELKTRPNTVGKWRDRFLKRRIKGLYDAARSGKPKQHGPEVRNKLLKKLEEPAPKGQATWDGKALGKALGILPSAVWRILRKEGVQLQRARSWCVSTDKEFGSKAANIMGLYLNPPENALVLSADEKPSIQALERSRGYVPKFRKIWALYCLEGLI